MAKREFSFDEKKDALEIVKNGFGGSVINYNQMYLIAKYLKDVFGYGEVRIEREIIKFCKKHDENFNPIVEAPSIKKWVKTAMNYRLRKIKDITISQKEIDTLKTIDVEKERRLLFSTLVFSKALKGSSTRRKNKEYKTSTNHYIRYNNLLDIIRLSGVKNISEMKFLEILHKYKDWFYLYNPEKELIKVLFIDTDQEKSFKINNLDNIMEYYESCFGESHTICIDCKKPFIKKKMANNQVRCDECSLKRRREKQRNLMKRIREREKL